MKSKIISTLLCVIVLGATFWLLFQAPIDKLKETGEETNTATDTVSEPLPETKVTRAFVIEAAHDAEDLLEKLAFGDPANFDTSLSDLAQRLSKSADFLKNEVKDYYGASYFTKVSEIFQEVQANPFANSADFSQRTSRILTELENAFPTEAAQNIREDDPENPMYYPRFDTAVNGKTTLALLAVYREQYKKSTNSILLTFGGNLAVGDTLLGADKEGSFKSSQSKSAYSYPLYRLSSVFSTDTASFANLTAPLTESIGDSTAVGNVKGLPAYAKLLKSGGIDLVSVSDPGVSTFGATGKADTKKALEEADVLFSDEGSVAYQQTSLGVVAYLTYDIIDEIQSDVNHAYEEAPKQDIAAARAAGAKIVIVHFNWVTTEKRACDPSDAQVLTTRRAVDNGADLVFGSHPTALQSIEQYKGVNIVYSAGNLFQQGGTEGESFLFQQAFSLDSSGNVVRGEIQLYPLVNTSSADGVPTLAFESAYSQVFLSKIVSYSGTVRYGVGKRASFTADQLNIISIQK